MQGMPAMRFNVGHREWQEKCVKVHRFVQRKRRERKATAGPESKN